MSPNSFQFLFVDGDTGRTSPVIKLWLLRALATWADVFSLFMADYERGEANSVAGQLGLPLVNQMVKVTEETTAFKIHKKITAMHRRAEKKLQHAPLPLRLERNLIGLCDQMGLETVEQKILGFAILLHANQTFNQAAKWFNSLSIRQTHRVLSVVLSLPEDAVLGALNKNALLIKTGILTFDRGSSQPLAARIKPLSEEFAESMLSNEGPPIDIFKATVLRCTPAALKLANYGHVDKPLSRVLLPLLRNACSSGRRGVNLLIHGAPGVGKSELARVIAEECQCALYEIAHQDADSEPLSREDRFRYYRIAQSMLFKHQSIVLVDEVGDLFDEYIFWEGTPRKARLNQAFEDNPVPTLWIAGDIESMDKASISRFDMVLELPLPPKSKREAIVRQACEGILKDAEIERVAGIDCLSPAVIARAAKVVQTIRPELGETQPHDAMEILIGNTLAAQGYDMAFWKRHGTPSGIYDPSFIQADCNLAQVASGLAKAGTGRLCLYGPPGTGKTAYGHWVAKQLDLPIHVQRASELMSKYVGDNEKNIAQSFTRAMQEGAILLIDEVDSFLQDRRGARASWEVTLVNEFLTRMEDFQGIFIATTNLIKDIDPAALRRFDLKARFDYLRSEQAVSLLEHYCDMLGMPAPQPLDISRLARLNKLTPGDYASVIRKSRFMAINSTAEMVNALENECRMKGESTRAIGFV